MPDAAYVTSGRSCKGAPPVETEAIAEAAGVAARDLNPGRALDCSPVDVYVLPNGLSFSGGGAATNEFIGADPEAVKSKKGHAFLLNALTRRREGKRWTPSRSEWTT